jgi:hypothetical protein
LTRTFTGAAILVAFGALVLSSAAIERRQIRNELSEAVEGRDRYVDAGIHLQVVVADPDGEVLVPNAPRLRVLREHRFGGIIDTRARPAYRCGPSRDPVQWYCSEDQEPIILHRDEQPLGQLVYGSEGAGKTTALAMWHALRWLEHLGEGREGLQTAPIGARLELVRAEMVKLWRPSWYRYKVADEIFEMCDGSLIRMISTYRQSEAVGSPVQGFNSSWAGVDEAQDQVEVHEDIESRGRSARIVDGEVRYKQLRTATAKDNSAWRTLRDKLLSGRLPDGRMLWIRRSLDIKRSPFIAPSFLIQKRQSMSAREFRRRYDAVDLPPELATYPAWSREHNLIRVPSVGWEDVTALELERWGPNLTLAAGHDPGSLFNVTLLAKAYVPNGRIRDYMAGRTSGRVIYAPRWVIRGEVTSEQSTTERHIVDLLEVVRGRWNANLLDRHGRPVRHGPQVFVRADPYGNNETRPDRSVYTLFRNAGIKIEPAAYSVEGSGPGRVDKDAGIEVVNTLLCSAAAERRLYIELDEYGAPVAPKLVEAFESQERDHRGKAETQRKDVKDLSHWPSALRYLLWPIERPRLQRIAEGQSL